MDYPVIESHAQPTGLVCVQCSKPVATIESDPADAFVFHCPACGHRWTVQRSESQVVENEPSPSGTGRTARILRFPQA